MDAYPPGSRHPGRRGGRKSGKATGGGSGPGDDQAGGLGTAVFALTLLAMILILAGYILLLVHGGSGAPLCSDRTLSDNMGRVGTGIASLFLVMAFGTVLIPALGLVCCNRTTRAAFGWSMHGSPPPSGRRGDGLASTTGARGGGTADTQSASQASRSTTGTEPAVTGVGHSIDVHDLGTQASAQSDSFVRRDLLLPDGADTSSAQQRSVAWAGNGPRASLAGSDLSSAGAGPGALPSDRAAVTMRVGRGLSAAGRAPVAPPVAAPAAAAAGGAAAAAAAAAADGGAGSGPASPAGPQRAAAAAGNSAAAGAPALSRRRRAVPAGAGGPQRPSRPAPSRAAASVPPTDSEVFASRWLLAGLLVWLLAGLLASFALQVFAFGHVFRYSDPDIQGRLQTCAQPLRVIVEVSRARDAARARVRATGSLRAGQPVQKGDLGCRQRPVVVAVAATRGVRGGGWGGGFSAGRAVEDCVCTGNRASALPFEGLVWWCPLAA